MEHVGVTAVRSHFGAMLRRVAAGEELAITRRGVTVAKLVPVVPDRKPDVAAAIAAIREVHKGRTLGGLRIGDMIEEGRH